MRKLVIVLAVSAAAFAAPAYATTVLSDNFDSEAGAPTTLNYHSFANFNVTGQVDLVGTGNPYGTTGAGSYVDLDGTSGPGTITTKSSYAFNAGDLITLSFDLSPSQRSTNPDDFFAGFTFGAPLDVLQYTLGGAWGGNPGDFLGTPSINTGTAISGPIGADPFQTYTISFIAGSAGSLQAFLGTASADNVGPLLDNVVLDISPGQNAVPEPATMALMIGGLGLVGGAMRRRRARAAVAG